MGRKRNVRAHNGKKMTSTEKTGNVLIRPKAKQTGMAAARDLGCGQ